MQQSVTYQYVQAVKAIKQAIQVSRYRVSRHANGVSLGLYYAVGKYISEHTRNAAWGTGAIEQISNQLQQEMPGLIGFSAQNIRRMRQFYEECVEVFENRSSVMSEMGIIPLSADIQPEAPPRNQPLIFGLPMCVHILPIQKWRQLTN